MPSLSVAGGLTYSSILPGSCPSGFHSFFLVMPSTAPPLLATHILIPQTPLLPAALCLKGSLLLVESEEDRVMGTLWAGGVR